MIKYYTRACNFFYGDQAKLLIKKNVALPLCGRSNIGFSNIEIFSRNKNKIKSKLIKISQIKSLKKKVKIKIKKDLKNYFKKEKFFKKCEFF